MKTSCRAVLLALSILASPLRAADDFIDPNDLFDDLDDAPATRVADPLKGFNKAMFQFNDWFYREALAPVSRGYRKLMPNAAERGVSNFFDNLNYPVRLAGSVFQFKFERAGKETAKFALNTVAGLGGFFDPAKDYTSLQTPDEDIGQAFASWGVGHGFYIVLPFLGPTTARDLVGNVADGIAHPVSTPWTLVEDSEPRIAIQALEIVNNSPRLLENYNSMVSSAFNPYEGLKDAYIQLRLKQVSE